MRISCWVVKVLDLFDHRNDRVQLHGRLQVDFSFAGFVRHQPVNQDTGAHHVQVVFGIVDDSTAVAAVPQGKMYSQPLKAVAYLHKAVVLLSGVLDGSLVVLICTGKVGEDAVTAQIGELADLCNLFHCAV